MVFLFCLAFSSVNWSLIQRYYCVPREKDALKVGSLVTVLNILGPPLILLPAMAARHFLTGVEDANEVYPMLCKHLLPAGMLGLIIAAMFSATMSMLSSDYNVAASVLTNDLYRRYINPKASQGHLVWVGRLMTLVVGLTALGVAFLMVRLGGDDLFRAMVTLFSVATAPVALPMITGLLFKRISRLGALLGCLSGVIAGVCILLLTQDETTWWGVLVKRENLILWGTTITTLIVMLVGSLALPHTPAEAGHIEAFHRRLKTPVGQLPEDVQPVEGKVISPFGIVGVCTAIIGLMMIVVLPWVREGLAFKMAASVGAILFILGALTAYVSHRHNVRLLRNEEP
jgi:Na+/proline symporter